MGKTNTRAYSLRSIGDLPKPQSSEITLGRKEQFAEPMFDTLEVKQSPAIQVICWEDF